MEQHCIEERVLDMLLQEPGSDEVRRLSTFIGGIRIESLFVAAQLAAPPDVEILNPNGGFGFRTSP